MIGGREIGRDQGFDTLACGFRGLQRSRDRIAEREHGCISGHDHAL